uniref:Uncharacterized protein n=1 Tax=Glossina brevipalpis TaxID=37001 RepID=A0A1A9WWX4_9MUSC
MKMPPNRSIYSHIIKAIAIFLNLINLLAIMKRFMNVVHLYSNSIKRIQLINPSAFKLNIRFIEGYQQRNTSGWIKKAYEVISYSLDNWTSKAELDDHVQRLVYYSVLQCKSFKKPNKTLSKLQQIYLKCSKSYEQQEKVYGSTYSN